MNAQVCIYKMKYFSNFGGSAPHVEKMECDEVCCKIAL